MNLTGLAFSAYGDLKGNQAGSLKELERRSRRFQRVVVDLALEKAILKDAAEGNF